MRSRSSLLLTAALLLMAAAASATTLPGGTEATPLPAVPAPAASSAAAQPGCNASLFGSDLPRLTPMTQTCGSCSQPICKGVVYNSGCYQNGQFGACLSPLGNNCTGTPFTWQCQCWSGPLP